MHSHTNRLTRSFARSFVRSLAHTITTNHTIYRLSLSHPINFTQMYVDEENSKNLLYFFHIIWDSLYTLLLDNDDDGGGGGGGWLSSGWVNVLTWNRMFYYSISTILHTILLKEIYSILPLLHNFFPFRRTFILWKRREIYFIFFSF